MVSILRHILLISLLLMISTIVSAKKMILPIEVVAGTADMIVIGEIISVDNNFYLFRVTETIKGKSSPVIRVEQFDEWTCDVRYAKAKAGQKLFLFLKNVNGKFEIINGSTGEIPVIDNTVTLAYERYSHTNYKSSSYKLKLAEFKAGIKGFIHLFAMIGANKGNDPVYFLQNGKESELKLFMATGGFAQWIYEKLQLHYKIVKS